MAKQRQTNVNIDYKVNTVDIERGNALLNRISKTTDDVRKATDTYNKQASAGYRFTSKTIEGMSIEVARLKQQVKLASVQNTADVQRLSAQYRSAKAQLDAYNRSLLQTTSAAKQTASATKGMATQFGEVYTAIRAVIAAGFIRELINMQLEMAKLSGAVEGVEKAFLRLPNAELLLHSLREATHGTVTDLELMQKALRANNFKIPLEQLGVLLEFAAVKAQQTGQEVNHLVEYIVSGIGYRAIRRLDDLGFTANRVNKALGDVSLQAASMGQIMNAVVKLMNEDLQQTGGYAETTATTVGQITTAWHELKVALSEKLTNSPFLQTLKSSLEGASDIIKAFPTDRLSKLFSTESLNPIKALGNFTDIFAFWHMNMDDVMQMREIEKRALEETSRIEKRLSDHTAQEKLPLIDEEIKKKQKVADEYFYAIQAADMTIDKFSEENILRKKNLKEIEETIRLLKAYRKAQQDILDTPPETEENKRGRPKAMTQVVDLRFRNPDTGLISKERNSKILDDFFGLAGTWLSSGKFESIPAPVEIPIKPFLAMSDWEKALESHRMEITDTAAGIISDIANSELMREVDEYNQRINATRDFYDEQISLAGDNERAKQELRIKEQRELKKLEKERADAEKKAALASIRVNTALAIIKVFAGGGTFADKIIRAAIVGAQGAAQYIIASRQRYYNKGEIDIKGGIPGKDSIPAMLTPHESVMTADETKSSMGIFKAVRAKKLNDRVLQEIMSGRSGGATVAFDDSRLLKKLDEVKNSQPDLLQRANLAYEIRKSGDNYKKIIRSKAIRS